jgi:hypothetical protein
MLVGGLSLNDRASREPAAASQHRKPICPNDRPE